MRRAGSSPRHPVTKPRWGLALTMICLSALTGLLIHPPIGWLHKPIKQLTDERLQITALSGHLWQGSAKLAMSDGQRLIALPGELSWNMRPWQLLRGQLPLILQHPQLAEPLNIIIERLGVQWSAGRLHLPAQWLTSLGAPWNTIRPEGRIEAQWPAGSSQHTQSVDITWFDAQSVLSRVRPLGAYHVQVNRQSSGDVNFSLKTLQGPLILEGKGMAQMGQGLRFEGTADTDAAHRDGLVPLLVQIARRDGEKFRLKI